MSEVMAKQHHQLRLFSALIMSDVLNKHRSMLGRDPFSSSNASMGFKTLLRVYDAVGKVPSRETFLLEIHKDHGGRAVEVIGFVDRAYSLPRDEVITLYVPDLKQLIELSWQKKCHKEALEALSNGDVEEARRASSRAQLKVEGSSRVRARVRDRRKVYLSGDDPFERGKRWPTLWPEMNHILGGGVAEGELHILVGPKGRGKTRLASNMALHTAMVGGIVEVISLETREGPLQTRLDQMISGLLIEDLCTEEGVDHLENEWAKIPGDVYFKKFQAKSIDLGGINSYLRTLDPMPNVVILDYMELLSIAQVTNTNNYWMDEGWTYAMARAMAEDLGIAVWALTQPTKGSENNIVHEGQVSGSGQKGAHADSMWSIHLMGTQLNDSGKFGLWNMKNRHGPDRLLVELQLDHDRTNMLVTSRAPDLDAGLDDRVSELANNYLDEA